ncbi:MAG: hypothetical protein QOH95_880 [Gaiellaceae bacterium]|nr:hypothetical protein [Gaiellaceae bacterium]
MEARHRAILYAIAGSGIVALIVVGLLVTLGGGGGNAKAAAKALTAAGCQYKHYPEQPRSPHYATLTPNPPPHWNSFPPTSGRHYGQWVLWGDYTEPQPLIKSTHNLEHGGVIIQYGNKVGARDIDKINAFWQADPNAMLVAPLPKLGNKIALTSWTQWAECTKFDQNAFSKFRSAFRYHAPESSVFPKSALEPGK